jgi:hypothetical protein
LRGETPTGKQKPLGVYPSTLAEICWDTVEVGEK